MMPYDTYRLYQVERAKSSAEVRHADEQAARVASAASSLFRGITRPWRAMRRSSPVTTRDLPPPSQVRSTLLPAAVSRPMRSECVAGRILHRY